MTIHWDDQQFEQKLQEWWERSGSTPTIAKIHPIARLFPPMEADAWDTLLASVAHNGVMDAVLVSESGDLADGIHRTTAWLHLSLTDSWKCPESQRGLPCAICPDERVEQAALAMNLGRRHLTASQRAAMAEKMCRGSGSKPGRKRKRFYDYTLAAAAEAMNVSKPYVTQVRSVLEADRRLADDIFRGHISIPNALATLAAQGKGRARRAESETKRQRAETERHARAGWERGREIAHSDDPGPQRPVDVTNSDPISHAVMWLVAQPGVVIPQDVLEEFEGRLR